MMTIRLGQIAPDFEQDTANGSIRFHAWLGDAWGLLFSLPAGASEVSAAELHEVARLKPEWGRRMVRPVALAGGVAQDLLASQCEALSFPLVADCDHSVARLYGIAPSEAEPAAAVRCVFVIDPQKRVRLILTYPRGAGRNFPEILRVIDGLQIADAQLRRITPQA